MVAKCSGSFYLSLWASAIASSLLWTQKRSTDNQGLVAALLDEKHDKIATCVALAHSRIEVLTSNVAAGDAPKPWTVAEHFLYFRHIYPMLLDQLVGYTA